MTETERNIIKSAYELADVYCHTALKKTTAIWKVREAVSADKKVKKEKQDA